MGRRRLLLLTALSLVVTGITQGWSEVYLHCSRPSSRRKQPGTDSTGFGLPVSLAVAEAMGGGITTTSIGRKHGSTFRLVLGAGSG